MAGGGFRQTSSLCRHAARAAIRFSTSPLAVHPLIRMTQTRFLRRHAADILISLVLFVGALVMRRPHLMLLPAFSDESLEVRWAMDIALGRRLPLTAYDSYYGPLFPYLIAGAFKVFGVGLTVPRTVIMVFGSLTASATFWCGRVVSGRWTGAIAGCLVAVSPALVFYSSHYGWSNSLTPCFSILAVTCLYLGVQRENRRALAIGGVLVALTLQTHPLTVVGWAGAAFWLIHSRRRYPWLTWNEVARRAVFFAIGYSPMLLANVLTPATSLRLAVQRTYAFAPTVDPAEYTRRLVDLLTTLVDMLAGGLAVERFPAIPAAFVVAAAVLDGTRGCRLGEGNTPHQLHHHLHDSLDALGREAVHASLPGLSAANILRGRRVPVGHRRSSGARVATTGTAAHGRGDDGRRWRHHACRSAVVSVAGAGAVLQLGARQWPVQRRVLSPAWMWSPISMRAAHNSSSKKSAGRS